MTPDEFRRRGHELIDWIADYVEGVEQRPVAPVVEPGDVRGRLPAHPPAAPEPWDAVMADVDDVIVPGIIHWQHPSFFAYFPSNTTYPSILGELLTAGLGVQGMSWVTSPACTELETLDARLDGRAARPARALPLRRARTGGGVIQGSASEATLVGDPGGALAGHGRRRQRRRRHDAPRRLRHRAGPLEHREGPAHRRHRHRPASAPSPTTSTFAMRPDALAEAIAADRAAGLVPFFVCATHGTTSSMAFDPTPAIGADLPATHGVWLHVDAAMSGIAALAPEHRWVNDGLERADSYCTNPHKWMGVNFDCDLFWTADRGALLGALSILPEYLRSAAAEAGAAIDYRDWQVPLGRRFRALKLWLTLRLDGVGAIQDDDPPPRRAHPAPRRPRSPPTSASRSSPRTRSTCCASASSSGDAATDALIERANATGEVLFTRTVLDGRSAPCASRSAPRPPSGATSPPPGTCSSGSPDRAIKLGSDAARGRSTSMWAVAPQTVSSSSSKKCSRRSVGVRPQRSER